MNLTIDDTTMSEIRAFNRNVDWLRKRELKDKCTASAADVMKATGWTYEQLRHRKNNGFVKAKRINGKFRYDIESIPKHLIINS